MSLPKPAKTTKKTGRLVLLRNRGHATYFLFSYCPQLTVPHSACSDRGDARMTHDVAAWPPDRPGGIVVGKMTRVWCPRVSLLSRAAESLSSH
eukprot:7195895-Prymnesium_polylepis.1